MLFEFRWIRPQQFHSLMLNQRNEMYSSTYVWEQNSNANVIDSTLSFSRDSLCLVHLAPLDCSFLPIYSMLLYDSPVTESSPRACRSVESIKCEGRTFIMLKVMFFFAFGDKRSIPPSKSFTWGRCKFAWLLHSLHGSIGNFARDAYWAIPSSKLDSSGLMTARGLLWMYLYILVACL
jgi:hypothetical protein